MPLKYATYESGEKVRLDWKFRNRSVVSVVSQSPNRMFTEVELDGVKWEVMTNRLSKNE